MKRKLFIVLAFVLSITMAGCSGSEKKIEEAAAEIENTMESAAEKVEDAADEIEETAKEVDDIADSIDEASEEMEEVLEVLDEESAEEKEEFVSDRSRVFDLLSNIKIGWNLGNSLDVKGLGNTLDTETFWGNPKTTQAMIDEVSGAGFNAIRIPITWGEHLGEAPDYKIDEAWFDRVQEVVDYAVNDDMYILINTHHEEGLWLDVDPANEDKLTEELCAIWVQIAERFKDYDEKLIFEGMNEPRMVGSSKEWNGGTDEERVVINHMNQAFIDTVRATGGNNENRVLVICTYGNSANMNAIKALEIPEDNNIAVALHMYTPYEFTFVPESGPNVEVWDGSNKASIVNTVKLIDEQLLKKDVPVIVDEFGAQNKENNEEIIKWLDDYLGTMNKYGIKCFWWDNGTKSLSGGEAFGIFNRNDVSWYQPDIKDALVKDRAE